jgi:hypothetical protein
MITKYHKMRSTTPIILISLLFASMNNQVKAQFHKNHNDSLQEAAATQIMDSLENGNKKYLLTRADSIYLRSQKAELDKKLNQFIGSYSAIRSGTKRYTTLVSPEALNTFRFRYIGDSGVLLQADISFKKERPDLFLSNFTIIPATTFREQLKKFNPLKKPQIKSTFNQLPDHSIFIDIRNCSNEKRTITFDDGINFIWHWASGSLSLSDNRVVKFSKEYKPDTAFLKAGVYEIRKALPVDFWTYPIGTNWYDYTPGEKGIWFIRLLAHEDKAGQIRLYAGYKVTFEGTDARIDAQRSYPKIKNIDFFTDKESLAALETILKTSAKKVQ